MLIVIGRVSPAPGKDAEVNELMVWMQTESLKEPGCLRYGFYRAVDGSGDLIAVEEWESADALRTHFGAPTVARFGAELGTLIAGPPEVKIHGIGRTNDFPDLEGLG
jgi:quinol monooxygenase YgiN